MQTRSSRQPSMFDELSVDTIEQQQLIQVEVTSDQSSPYNSAEAVTEEKILRFLASLKLALSLDTLRNTLAEVKNLLAHSHFEELPFDLTPGYLIAELDQIEASLTLDRAKYYVERLEKSSNPSKN